MATDTDYLIIGAGPAGLQLGHHLARAGRDYRLLEAVPTPGTFFRTFPRHRQLITDVRNDGGGDPDADRREQHERLPERRQRGPPADRRRDDERDEHRGRQAVDSAERGLP